MIDDIYYKTQSGKLYNGDAMEVLKTIPDNTFTAVITDPPYGLSDHNENVIREVMLKWLSGEDDYVPKKKGFMGKAWDGFVPPPALWREVYRVMKPGATALVFSGTRTYDLMTLSLRLAEFEIKDTLMWLYGCVSEDTEILTTNGWKKWNELSEGEEIYNLNLLNGKIEKDIVLEKFVYDIEDELINIKNDNTDQLITKNHKVILKYHTSHKWTWKYAKMIMSITEPIFIPVYNIMNRTISSIPINTGDIKVVKYKGKVWSIRTNNMTYIARRNGKIFITGNSGFPKAQDISKMIDKKLGKFEERKIIGKTNTTYPQADNSVSERSYGISGANMLKDESAERVTLNITAPATPEAELWDGHKTHSLKPAYEPIIMAIKPNDGSYADNALKWGVSGLNIDPARVGNEEIFVKGGKKGGVAYGDWSNEVNQTHIGRFPANVLLDEEAAKMVDEQSGRLKSGGTGMQYKRNEYNASSYMIGNIHRTNIPPSEGGASRFFYVAKASRTERKEYNNHPTVKPIALIEYLIKLIKQSTYNYILDPFVGSGTTAIVCEKLNINWLCIDNDEHSCYIAKQRIRDIAMSDYKRLKTERKSDDENKELTILGEGDDL